jgi:hypothetical protein
MTKQELDNLIIENINTNDAGLITGLVLQQVLLYLADYSGNKDELMELFLSKLEDDTAQGFIEFLKGISVKELAAFLEGIEVGPFSSGPLGSGAAIKMVNGISYAEVDHLTVRQKATFRELIIEALKHIGGQLVLTPARMKCVRVVEEDTFYKCYFDTGDGEVSNEFVAGDLARCQVFTGSGIKFYWRLVTLVGEDWINLSKTSAAVGSDAPEAGDDIVQLGNATDTTRQSAIILSTVGADAPSWKQYSGINSFSLEGKETTVFSKLGNRIEGKTVFTSGGANLDDHLDGVAQDILDALQAAQDAEDKAQQAIEDAEANVTDYNAKFAAVQAQIDGEVSNWFYPYSPTLANYPASDWTTNEIKDRHIGDTFTNMQTFVDNATTPDAGKSWRFVKNGSTYSWTAIADSDAVKALLEASKAQATADGKSTTHLFQPTKYKLGDMWVLNADQTVNGTAYKQGDILTATQDSETFNEAHWLKRVRYTDDTAVENLQVNSRNYVRNSRLDNLTGWSTTNGTRSIVNDAKFGNVVQWARTSGSPADYQKEFALVEKSSFEGAPITLFVIAKKVSTSGFFCFGWNGYATFINSDSSNTNQIDLGGGWFVFWRSIIGPASLTNSTYFGINTISGTWQFYAVGLNMANKYAGWQLSNEDVQAEIDSAKQEAENAQTLAERAQLQADGYMRARYVRDWLKGNTDHNNNNWSEIKVVNKAGVNLALGLPANNISSNGTWHASYPKTNVIDGNTSTQGYISQSTPTLNYVQIDLGQIHYDIDYIQVWHAGWPTRLYYGTKTEISTDGVNWTTIFDSAVEGTYAETAEGKIHTQRYAKVIDKLAETSAKTKYQTNIDGGLIYTALMKLFSTLSGNETAFISGLQGAEKDLPAFGAGTGSDGSNEIGAYEAAAAVVNFMKKVANGQTPATNEYDKLAKIALMHNGAAKIGHFFIEALGRIFIADPSTGKERLVFLNQNIPTVATLESQTQFGDSISVSPISVSPSYPNGGSSGMTVSQDGSKIVFNGATINITGTLSGTAGGFASAALILVRNGVNYYTYGSANIYLTGGETKSDSVVVPAITLTGLPSGSYAVKLALTYSGTFSSLSGSSSSSTLSWSFSKNVEWFQFGLNGMMAWYQNTHLYASDSEVSGKAPADKWDTPGVLLSATVNTGGGWGAIWGAKRSSTQPVNNSTGRYTVYHTVGHTNYQVNAIPNTANRTCHIVSKAASNFVIEWRTVSSSPTLVNTGFDFQIIGNNYA